MQKCTPTGYAIRGIAGLVGFVGLLLLIGVVVYLAYRGVAGTFTAALLWLLTAPFGVGLVGEALYLFSCWLAARKGFRYDFDRREASWLEGGQRISYTYRSDA